MRTVQILVLCLAGLLLSPQVWAHGGMGGGMGGMDGDNGLISNLFNNMMNRNHDWPRDPGQGRDSAERYSEHLQKENRALKRHYEMTHQLQQDINEKTEAIDRESRREHPDSSRLTRLHDELNMLKNELDREQRQFEQYMNNDMGRYSRDDERY